MIFSDGFVLTSSQMAAREAALAGVYPPLVTPDRQHLRGGSIFEFDRMMAQSHRRDGNVLDPARMTFVERVFWDASEFAAPRASKSSEEAA